MGAWGAWSAWGAFISCCLLLSLLRSTFARGPPRLTSQVQAQQMAHAGDTVRLACPVTSDPPALTSWHKDDEAIHSGWERFRPLDRLLRIRGALPEDSGIYVCKATNGFGSVTVTHELYVLADDDHREDGSQTEEGSPEESASSHEVLAPRFSHAAEMRRPHVTRKVGESVRLRCRARGHPVPHVTWLREGGDPLVLVAPPGGESRPVLRLTSLRLTDSGRYTCSVTNSVSSLNFTYTLDVVETLIEKPSLIPPFPNNTTVEIDDTASFMCRVRSDLEPHIQWLKRVDRVRDVVPTNRTIVIDGRPFVVVASSVTQRREGSTYLSKLSIAGAQPSDAGLYMCLGANSVGYSVRSAFLTVHSVPPRFTRPAQMQQKPLLRPVGASVRFDCRAAGKPTPRVAWSKDGRHFPVASSSPASQWALILTELRQIDNGRYTCHLTNSAGSLNFTYRLEVVDRLPILEPILEPPHPQNSTVAYGGATSFLCSAHQPHVQWLKRIDGPLTSAAVNATITVDGEHFVVLHTGRTLARQDGAYVNKLMIRAARPADAGLYVCLGVNSVGYSVRSAYLTVLPDPDQEKTLLPSPSDNFMEGASIPLVIGVPVAVLVIIVVVTVYVMCRRRQRAAAAAESPPPGPKAGPKAGPGGRPSYQMGVPDRRYIYTPVPHPNYPPAHHPLSPANQSFTRPPQQTFGPAPQSFSPPPQSFSPPPHPFTPPGHTAFRPPFESDRFSHNNFSDVRTESSSPSMPPSTAPSIQYRGTPRHAP